MTIQVDLDAGIPLCGFNSPSHDIEIVEEVGTSRVSIRLRHAIEIPNRDFVLTYRVDGPKVANTLLYENDKTGQPGTFALIVAPPAEPIADQTQLLISNLQFEWANGVEDVLPTPIPDLCNSQPLVILGRYQGACPPEVTIRGKLANQLYSAVIKRSQFRLYEGGIRLETLWAQKKIDALLAQMSSRPAADDIRKQIVAFAIRHSLATDFTSFLVVEYRSHRDRDWRQEGLPVVIPLYPPEKTPSSPSSDGGKAAFVHELEVRIPPPGEDHVRPEPIQAVRRAAIEYLRRRLSTDDLFGPLEQGIIGEVPKRIGPYRIIEKLGEGGMGVVYLAEQSRPIHRRVALKIIRAGMDSRHVVARFETEREALVQMNHPNVARVFDAGATPQGWPYLVMEHVSGIPITEYCDKHRLNTEERLHLFIDVCDAVQHVHQKGIIHRDIKPSNVLVSVQDEKSVPKLIDFGLAKAMQSHLTEKTILTEQGQLIGTPTYMSPEQTGMTAQEIDSRSDIYSLGVILYQLLVGILPFEPQELLGREMQRVIREVDPPKPSTRLSVLQSEPQAQAQGGASPIDKGGLRQVLEVPDQGASATSSIEHIAHSRRTEPKTLIKQIRGDLDWIAMMAMDKDRNRRYASAAELSADVERHLKNEPVLASPPCAAYRVRKFVRRNKAQVFAAAVITITLIAGLAAALLRREPKELLDPMSALSLAEKAVQEIGQDNYQLLETLALAFCQSGAIDRAVETQRKALALLPEDRILARAELEGRLGEYLVSQKNWAEAESLLLNAHWAISKREYVSSIEMNDSLERLVTLYESWGAAEPGKGYAERATQWRARLDELNAEYLDERMLKDH